MRPSMKNHVLFLGLEAWTHFSFGKFSTQPQIMAKLHCSLPLLDAILSEFYLPVVAINKLLVVGTSFLHALVCKQSIASWPPNEVGL